MVSSKSGERLHQLPEHDIKDGYFCNNKTTLTLQQRDVKGLSGRRMTLSNRTSVLVPITGERGN